MEWPYGKQPFAKYIFKYRSRDKWICCLGLATYYADVYLGDLQSEHIIPRSPTPVPLEERDPEDLNPEEARELVRRLRARNAEKVKIKPEVKQEKRKHATIIEDDDDDDDEEDVTFTGEAPAHKRGRTGDRDSGVEMIDLSED